MTTIMPTSEDKHNAKDFLYKVKWKSEVLYQLFIKALKDWRDSRE